MFLAVDLGSTYFKAAIYDGALNCLGTGAAALTYRYGTGGVVEFAVEHGSACFGDAIQEALVAAGVEPGALRALALTSQAQTFTVLAADGTPRVPFLSWQDARAQEECSQDGAACGFPHVARHSALGACIPLLLSCKLRHLQRATPGGLVQAGDRVLPLPTWFVWHLTGEAVLDPNLAGMSGLYSLSEPGWWPAALAACGITEAHLPRLAPLAAVAGSVQAANRWGLPPGIPLVLAGNDQTAGAWGARLHERGGLLITLGTSQVAYACIGELPPAREGVMRGVYLEGLHYQLVADEAGGATVNWAQTVLSGCEDDPRFFAAAGAAPPGCAGLAFQGDLGAGRGAWQNVAQHHTPGHFARSVLECLAERMAQMIENLEVDLARAPVQVAGGGSRCPLWVAILGKRLGVDLEVTGASPLLGAAAMAQGATRGT